MSGSGRYARGDNAIAICERCSEKRLRRHLIYDGQYPDLLVCPECWDPKHPQEYLPPTFDPVTIYDPTGDPDKSAANSLVMSFPPARLDVITPLLPLSIRATINATKYSVIDGDGAIPDDPDEFAVTVLPLLTSISFDSQFGGDAGETNFDEALGFDFNDDGTKFFIMSDFVGGLAPVNVFSLSTAWDITSASYLSTSSRVAPYGANRAQDLAWSDDGLSVFFTTYQSQIIIKHNVAVPYTPDWTADKTPAQTYDYSADFSTVSHQGIQFWPDGLSFVLAGGNADDKIVRYTLSVAWDLTTVTRHSTGAIVSSVHEDTRDVVLSGNGLRMWILDTVDETISQYSLSTAFDMSTLVDEEITLVLNGTVGFSSSICLHVPPGRKELYVTWYGATPALTLLEKYTWT